MGVVGLVVYLFCVGCYGKVDGDLVWVGELDRCSVFVW